MSPEADSSDRDALAHLDRAVEAMLHRLEDLEEKVRSTEARRSELQALLDRYRSGAEDPAQVARRAESLAAENQALRERLRDGRNAVERILARVRFLEEKK